MNNINIWKNKRLRQILLLVGSAIIILWLLIVILFYNFTVSQHEQSTLLRLAGIANSLALQIDGNSHEKIFESNKGQDAISHNGQDSLYLQLHLLLKANHTANMLKSPVYTITMNESGKFYEFGITSDTLPYFRHSYNTFHTTLNEKYKTGGIIGSYEDEFGMLLSAFAPIKNKDGKTVAVVMVDEKMDIFLSSVRSELIKAFLLSLFVFSVMITLLLWQLRKILIREQKDKYVIQDANNEITRINTELTVANEKLSSLDQFRKEMISNISDDLRTPMASIIGFLDLVRDKNVAISDEDKNKFLQQRLRGRSIRKASSSWMLFQL